MQIYLQNIRLFRRIYFFEIIFLVMCEIFFFVKINSMPFIIQFKID